MMLFNAVWRAVLGGSFIAAVVLAALLGRLMAEVEQPLPLTAVEFLDVERGAHLTAVAEQLEQRKLFGKPLVLRLYARYYQLEGIKAGRYALLPGSSAGDLLQALASGETVVNSITFPEGWRVAQWRTALVGSKLLRAEQPLDWALLAPLQLPPNGTHSSSLEGWLFPDTYHYRGSDGVKIIQLAVRRMQQELDSAWRTRAPGLPYANRYQLLIMASLIERETGLASERAQIAGVFVRRLQKGMRLQTDPTVIYGLGEAFDGDLRRADLKRPTAYNTYTIHGLPPTPIANPGAAALRAAAHPSGGDWLYFVGKGDGSHHFSVTLAEHQNAVKRYQRFRRADNYRSSPTP